MSRNSPGSQNSAITCLHTPQGQTEENMEHTPRDPRAGRRPAAEPDTRPQDTLVWGKNPVTELLKSGRPADTTPH